MSDKSCDCYSEDESSFFDSLFDVFIRGGTVAVMVCTTSYLIEKTIQHSGKIKELFSRLEKCEKNDESSQEHELKK